MSEDHAVLTVTYVPNHMYRKIGYSSSRVEAAVVYHKNYFMKEQKQDGLHIQELVLGFLPKEKVKNSQKIIRQHDLLERIGLKGNFSRDLFTVFLGIRLLKLEAYNNSLFLSDPNVQIVSGRFKVFGSIYRANLEKQDSTNRNISNAENGVRKRLKFLYKDLDDGTVGKPAVAAANEIELAVNDLVASSTIDHPTKRKAKFSPSEEVLFEWSKRWTGKFADTTSQLL